MDTHLFIRLLSRVTHTSLTFCCSTEPLLMSWQWWVSQQHDVGIPAPLQIRMPQISLRRSLLLLAVKQSDWLIFAWYTVKFVEKSLRLKIKILIYFLHWSLHWFRLFLPEFFFYSICYMTPWLNLNFIYFRIYDVIHYIEILII